MVVILTRAALIRISEAGRYRVITSTISQQSPRIRMNGTTTSTKPLPLVRTSPPLCPCMRKMPLHSQKRATIPTLTGALQVRVSNRAQFSTDWPKITFRPLTTTAAATICVEQAPTLNMLCTIILRLMHYNMTENLIFIYSITFAIHSTIGNSVIIPAGILFVNIFLFSFVLYRMKIRM